jgi:ribosomal 30S subunit maturation factor RimM
MIPFVEDYVISADIDRKEIVLQLPEGLIDLNEL